MIFKYLICVILIKNLNAQDEGLVNYNNKEFGKSRLFYEKVVDGREKDDAAKYGLGASFYKLKDMENAKKAFTDVQNSKSKKISSMAYFSLGNIYKDENKLEESLAFYRKAIQLNPNDKEAKINFELLKNMINDSSNDQSQDQESSDVGNDQSQDQESSDVGNDQSQDQESSDGDDNQSQEQEPQEKMNNELKEKQNPSEKDNGVSSRNEKRSEKNESTKNQNQSTEELNNSGEFEKTNDRAQAEAILDALKGKERISQKIKISKSKSTKLSKNW